MPMPFKKAAHTDSVQDEQAEPQTCYAFRFRAYWFVLAPIVGDYLIEERIRFLTAGTAIGLLVFQVLVAFVIAPSAAWHRLAVWISQ